nr:hypothetical protein 5 [Burkholderiaceae bacterium]
MKLERLELLAPLYDDCKEILPTSFEGWEIIPGYIDQEHVCTAILKGTEIHFGIIKKFRKKLIQRKRTREYLKPLLERKSFLTTRVIIQDKVKQKFIERLGFNATWNDETFQYYILTKLPFERERT